MLTQTNNLMQALSVNTTITMTSLEIAELTGKYHSNVMRDIRVMIEAISMDSDLNPCAKTSTYTGVDGRQYSMYELDKDTCLTLLLGYDAVARMRVIKRWQELEQGLVPRSLPEALRLAADLAEKNERLAIERDHAIATKAQIGSKREATAMATAAKHKREAEKLKYELGRNARHATIIAVERATGLKFPKNAYVALRKWCKKNNAPSVDVVDDRYGSVKAWPAGAWLAEFDVDLSELFVSEAA